MKHSDSILKIAPAFLAAQQKIGAAKKGSSNPFFHSRYADLGSVMEACKDALNEQGIAVLQPVMGNFVETVLLHTSGEWISSETPIVVKEENNPQATGSAISYARRYGLQSAVFIPSEDDDANTATGAKKKADKDFDSFMTPKATVAPRSAPTATTTGHVYTQCEMCHKSVSEKVETMSKRLYKKVLCFGENGCQNKYAKTLIKPDTQQESVPLDDPMPVDGIPF